MDSFEVLSWNDPKLDFAKGETPSHENAKNASHSMDYLGSDRYSVE
jgi:hypothetical protein